MQLVLWNAVTATTGPTSCSWSSQMTKRGHLVLCPTWCPAASCPAWCPTASPRRTCLSRCCYRTPSYPVNLMGLLSQMVEMAELTVELPAPVRTTRARRRRPFDGRRATDGAATRRDAGDVGGVTRGERKQIASLPWLCGLVWRGFPKKNVNSKVNSGRVLK
jgi:hypothetical protein